jgi:hypothetical protein
MNGASTHIELGGREERKNMGQGGNEESTP